MVTLFKQGSKLLQSFWQRWQRPPVPLVRPTLDVLARPETRLPAEVQACPVARKYLKLLGGLDWSHFPVRDPQRVWSGPEPEPRSPFVAAYLVKLNEPIPYMSGLRRYLIEHPALVWLLGFPLCPALEEPWGFDVAASVPTQKQFVMILKELDNQVLQYLLDQTVGLIKRAVPSEFPLGQIISLDTKHILAWVKENNPRCFIEEGRHNPDHPPKGDPDCKLGVKRRSNQHAKTSPPTPTTQAQPASQVQITEMYWGYGSGVVATKIPAWGEVVLAELTQPFNESDVSYFTPLMAQVERRLGFRPPFGAYDAAFDAWYVYEYHHQAGGLAAVPFVQKGGLPARLFDEQHRPLCAAGLGMNPKTHFHSYTDFVPQDKIRFACPLQYPEITGQPCPINHPK